MVKPEGEENMKTEEVNREEMENISGRDNSYRKILLDEMEKEKKKVTVQSHG
jgi:hypothetical protein